MNVDAAVWGVIGTVVGAGASIATTWLGAWHSEKSKTKQAREERVEQARAFQRETLIHLQTTIQEALTITANLYAEARADMATRGRWTYVRYFDSDRSPISKTMRSAEALMERIADDNLRVQCDRFLMDLMKAHLVQTTPADFEAAVPADQFVHLNNAIGKVLRSYFEPIPVRQN